MGVEGISKAFLKRWYLIRQNEGLSTLRSTSFLPMLFFSFKIYLGIQFMNGTKNSHIPFIQIPQLLALCDICSITLSCLVVTWYPVTPKVSSIHLPKTRTPLHCTAQSSQPGSQHWYNTTAQSIGPIHMMPAIPTVFLFPFLVQELSHVLLLVALSHHSGTLSLSYPNFHVPDNLIKHRLLGHLGGSVS